MAYDSTRRKNQAQSTRKKIMESAVRLFSEKDFSQVSVDSIVQDAGMAKGSFYLHYSSKDALIADIVESYVNSADSGYEDLINDNITATAQEQLYILADKISHTLIADIGQPKMKALYKAQLNSDFGLNYVVSYDRRLYTLIIKIIQRGIDSDEFCAAINAPSVTRLIVTCLRGITYEWCVRQDLDFSAYARHLISAIMPSLTKPQP